MASGLQRALRQGMVVFMFIAYGTVLPAASQPTWYLLAREAGCVDLQAMVRMAGLSRAPVSPENFAQMLRDRGEQVEVGLPEGFPQELAGKAVQVRYGNGKSPIFVQEEICRTIEKGK